MIRIIRHLAFVLIILGSWSLQAGTLVLNDSSTVEKLYLAPYMDRYAGESLPADMDVARALPDSAYVPVGSGSHCSQWRLTGSVFLFATNHPGRAR